MALAIATQTTEQQQNVLAILTHLSAENLAALKTKAGLGNPTQIGQETIDKLATLFAEKKFDLSNAGVVAFKDAHRLGNLPPLRGVIGSQTAEVFFNEFMARVDGFPNIADFSDFTGDIDWTAYKASGRIGAITKATEADFFKAETLQTNRQQMASNGLLCGLFHFAGSSFHKRIGDPIVEADFFLSKIGTLHDNEFAILDFELTYGLSGKELGAWAKAWLDHVHAKTGRRAFFYSFSSFIADMDTTGIKDNPLWVAQFPKHPDRNAPPSADRFGKVSMFQYSDHASVPGIEGTCDDSFVYVDVIEATR